MRQFRATPSAAAPRALDHPSLIVALVLGIVEGLTEFLPDFLAPAT